ncbi:MAG: lytic transglycosylase domain-containing protein [Bacillota bacterium]
MLDLNAIQRVTQTNGTTQMVGSTNASSFSSALQGSSSMEDIFVKASQTYDVPIDLIKAVAKAESNFNPSAESHAGAQGVMQLMPATARELGVTDSFNAEQNIMGGTKYLSQLLNRYNGDVTLALAGYNAGMGNVAKYDGVPPFSETQNYITKVMGYAQMDINTAVYPSSYSPSNSQSFQFMHESISNFQEFSMEQYLYFVELMLLNMSQSLTSTDSATEALMRQNMQILY